ncbi:MAG TPA: serine/threonine-protein kinase [Drouetiella sp.]|jgi:serine/threonine protein kinase
MSEPTDTQAKESKKVHVKLDCDLCGKPFKPKNRGSLTGWIFGEESVPSPKDAAKYCSCADIDGSAPFGSVNRAQTVGDAVRKSAHGGAASESAASVRSNAGELSAAANKSTLPLDANVGRKISDRYELLAVIGEGGMSTVYKANDSVLDKMMALKLLRKEFAANETSVKRFEQEANAVRSLTHPHLATVYDFGRTDDGAPYLVMDYIEGDSLSDLLKKEIFLDVPRALAICLQISTAVGYAHEHGVIHRDLKPENIILTNAGTDADFVKLIDFGIAKLQSDSGLTTQRVTQTGEIFGSPLYMSPEQCMGYPLDVRSDIYSLGCVMYELVTGKPPLCGENPVQTIFKHINENPTPFSVSFKHLNIPRGFEALVMKCLQKKPEDRYQSVADLRRDLKLVWLGKEIGKSKTRSGSDTPFYKSKSALYSVFALVLVYAVGTSVLLYQQLNSKPAVPSPSAVPVPTVSTGTPGKAEPDILTLAPSAVNFDDREPLKTNEPARLDWRLPQPQFSDMTFDINFHDELPKTPVLFLRLYEGEIGSSHFYFGFQTHLHDPQRPISPGRGLIFSRWGKMDYSDARIVMPGGFADGSPDAPFVGIRRLYPWGAHRYRVHLAMGNRDADGVWYDLSIENLDTNEVSKIGSLKFPKEKGEYPLIKDKGWTMLQILRGVKYQKDVPHWHVSFEKVRIGKDTNAQQNINVDYKQSEAADIFVKDEGKNGATIELLMQPYAKNQHSE